MEFFDAVGSLAIASRLKRLSDIFMSETRIIYRAENVDFEPRWFPVFFLLQERGEITVTEAAASIDVPHTYISQLVKEMRQAKLVRFKRHPDDGRSRIITLTPHGSALVDALMPLWKDIRTAVDTVIQSANAEVLDVLKRIEQQLAETPLSALVHAARSARSGITIVDYTPELRPHFEALNRAWLEKYFTVEPIDLLYFADPEGMVLQKGGSIFFAALNGEIVGTCSLWYDDGFLELARLAVDASAQGKGIGEVLAREAIRRAKLTGERRLRLYTNSKLVAAAGLYKKLGFKVTFRGKHPKYTRPNMIMELRLDEE